MYPLTFLLISLCSPYPIIATGHWCYDSQSAKCVQVKLQGDITIKGGNLPNTYKAVQFHFHWGTDSHPGSEHTIDGEQYPMELHIVHQNEKYTSFSEALNYDDGLAVLGFLFEESSEKNSKITDFIDMLKYVPYPGNKTWLEPFPLSKIIPDEELHKYYRYRGSLTTPTCNQVVIWTVFEETIPISKSQLNAFSENLYFSDSKHMKLNFRPVQNLNDRAVYVTGSAVRLFSAVGLSVGLAVWTSIFN
ncbi:carbonic anhydrase 4-like isoform X2 [Scyliorhinus canicula]|uniref:carbonic anhydrase 4-like isoform X2 n=1 Tax=Scyliorhinus canicula TaxID=7830 RepID=UPI0018F6734A|nr:carbonic anhydrase 4-like isoform X2 [Scyliorhinus canicula]